MSGRTLTEEQAALLAVASANPGSVLLTVIGSDNDILWGELADVGWMEPADMPKGYEAFGKNLNGWKATPELIALANPEASR